MIIGDISGTCFLTHTQVWSLSLPFAVGFSMWKDAYRLGPLIYFSMATNPYFQANL